jgi:hypothetical protein
MRHVTTGYDAEASCWYVQHSSLDGLQARAPTIQELTHKLHRIARSLLEVEDGDEVTVTVLKGMCWVRSGPQMLYMEHVRDVRDMAELRWVCCPGGELFKCFRNGSDSFDAQYWGVVMGFDTSQTSAFFNPPRPVSRAHVIRALDRILAGESVTQMIWRN